MTMMRTGGAVMNNDLSLFCRRAMELGANEARIIDTATVKTAAWVRMKCLFGCKHRKIHCCPPVTPEPEETRSVLDCYESAMLIHFTDRERTGGSFTGVVYKLEREIFLSGYYRAFGYGCGACMLCKACTPERCAHPLEARPSMESCGIDVFETVRGNGFPIGVVPDRETRGNYYGLVLIE
jgi:predicted metal-binding protein